MATKASRDSDELMLQARLVEGLYVINQERPIDTTLAAKESLTLWHERMRHINVQRLKTMRDGSASGIKFTNDKITHFHCDACTLGKAHRQPIFNKENPKVLVPGEKSHWDTCGPMPTSINGNH